MSTHNGTAGLYRRRGITNVVALVLSCATAVFGMFFLGWIWDVVAKGIAGIGRHCSESDPPPMQEGALLNASSAAR